ncbi:Na(+)/H(+) antiporter subunit D [Insolitispirillum peregrinum]|uniref:Multisubunit sodium/proton antiporter, MrpD subunit n=1 Tax=Insolitispirillum peregrinum TaxID=80876 RepID=A0A1N7NGL9_9PROT|nr:Na(+)/H(+) antiporter subunit D [Insolitispirillum peregrinum]SIS97442.1 multisubunit sodium/proton antiporter, MrpD subunit [Insolitispirillum peregrinum]
MIEALPPLPFPPGLILIAGGLLLPLIPAALRSGWLLLVPLLGLLAVWTIPDGVVVSTHWLGYALEPVQGDSLSRLFGSIFSIMAFAGALFSLKQTRTMELAAALAYAGGAVGVAFAGDLLTLFAFWEVMAIASATVLWANRTTGSQRAGMRYLMVHLLGGVVLMAGIAAHVVQTGSIDVVSLRLDTAATWLMVIGVLINAGAPPLSAWLPDAYPEASWSGTVFLSAFTTKTAVYVLLRCFPGNEILIWVGLYMVFYGILYALLENDMRRILAYSIINQVGFMVVGAGIGTPLAINGAAAHAFAHIIYKGLLLMSAGAVMYRTGKTKCTDLGGLFQSMPLTTLCGIIGALAISAFPWTSGFTTKSMVTAAAGHEHLTLVWYALEAASAGVFLHAGIKFPWFVFFQKDSGLRPKDPPRSMQAAMLLLAAFCIGLGVYPQPLYAMLPFAVEYVPYDLPHVVKQLQLLLFAGLAFFVLLPMMKRTLTITLDVDWFYRTGLSWLVGRVNRYGGCLWSLAEQGLRTVWNHLVGSLERTHGPAGTLARTWAVSSAMLWVIGLLGFYLILYYVNGS